MRSALSDPAKLETAMWISFMASGFLAAHVGNPIYWLVLALYLGAEAWLSGYHPNRGQQ
jgi:hypothetical protein